MIIRAYHSTDFFHVVRLLNKCNVEPPIEESDFDGLCIVAEEEDRIVGVIWALVGKSTHCHIDFFAVDPEYRGSNLGSNLLMTMDAALKGMGIKRYTFYVEPDNEIFDALIQKHGEKSQVIRLRDLKFYRRNLP